MNRRIVVRAVAIVVVAAAALAAADPAFAAPNPDTVKLIAVVDNIRNWIMGVAAAVATLFATVGAVRYMLAGGDPTEIERAKGAFGAALKGYALAFLAPVLFGIVHSWLV